MYPPDMLQWSDAAGAHHLSSLVRSCLILSFLCIHVLTQYVRQLVRQGLAQDACRPWEKALQKPSI